MKWFVIAVVIGSMGIARADEVAIGVNPPLSWLVGSFGVSGYAQVSEHSGVRINAARYHDPHEIAMALIIIGSRSEGGTPDGRVLDFGASWNWYPRAFLDGFGLELGAFYRHRATEDYFDGLTTSYTWRTQLVAARAVVSWNWRLGSSVFASISAGASLGYEHGTRTTMDYDPPDLPMPEAVNEPRIDFEAFARLGCVFRR